MIYSEKFSTALKRLILLSLVLLLYRLIIIEFYTFGIEKEESMLTMRNLLNFIYDFISIGTFWYLIYFLVKDREAVAIGFIFDFLISYFIIYIRYTNDYESFVFEHFYLISLVLNAIPFLLFGVYYFKNTSALFILIPYLAYYGIDLMMLSEYTQNSSLFSVFSYFIEGEIWIIESTSEGGFTRNINLFNEFIFSLSYPFLFVLIWWGISIIKRVKNNFKNFDFTLRTIYHTEHINKLTFSMMYWLFHIISIVVIFGGYTYSVEMATYEPTLTSFIRFLLLALSIYLLAIMYRNLLTQYFLQLNKYPSWQYFLINIPFLSAIIWLIVISSPQKHTEEDSLEEGIINDDDSTAYKSIQTKFVDKGKNNGIKIMYYIFIVLSIISVFYLLGNQMLKVDKSAVKIIFASFVIDIIFLTYYFEKAKAFMHLFIIELAAMLIINFFEIELSYALVSASSLFSLIFLYPLFHFDQLKIVEVEESDTEEKIVQSSE